MTDLQKMRDLAELATSGESGKWVANAELLTWFRSQPVAILDVLVAAEAVDRRKGGINHTALHEALKRLEF